MVAWFVGDDEKQSPRKQRQSKKKHRRIKPEAGALRQGRVDSIADTRVTIKAADVEVTISAYELCDQIIEHPSEVLEEGQTVDFVLLQPSYMQDGTWTGSIHAVREAKARDALARLDAGDRFQAVVIRLEDRGAVLDAGDFEVWVPISELAWSWLGHPSEAIAIDQKLDVQLLRAELREGWLHNKYARRARAVGSVRTLIPEPNSPTVPMACSGVPFVLSAIPKSPRSCDQIVLYALEEIASGRTPEEIQAVTALPRRALDAVHQLLTTEKLVKDWRATAKGKRLADALVHARELNADPIRILFVSAAHPASRIVSAEHGTTSSPYPRTWPRPPFNRTAEDQLVRASDEALPEALIGRIVTEQQRALLAQLQQDESLRVTLRRDGSRPWRAVYVPTPEHWIFAGLWAAFDPVGHTPFRPAEHDDLPRCHQFLMVRVSGHVRDGKQLAVTLYFEPNTKTLWQLRDAAQAIQRAVPGHAPPLLSELNKKLLTLPNGEEASELKSVSWCGMTVR